MGNRSLLNESRDARPDHSPYRHPAVEVDSFETAFAEVVASMVAQPGVNMGGVKLTPRESQILTHVALGLSNDEIARSFGISLDTVTEQVQQILRKLAVIDRTQAAVWAVQSGLV